jgi:CRISPR-associated protein Cmr3
LVVKNIPLWDQPQIRATVGDSEDYKTLRIRGPFVAAQDQKGKVTRYFPQPADSTYVDENDLTLIKALEPREKPEGVKTSLTTPKLLLDENDPVKGEENLWLPEQALLNYMRGEAAQGVPAERLFLPENRMGIGMDNQANTTLEAALYEVQYIRPRDGVGLAIEVNGYDDWPEEGVLRLGGEGHGGRFEHFSGSEWPLLTTDNGQENKKISWPQNKVELPPDRFKVYFATPAYFEDGWEPASWDQFFINGDVTLEAASLRRYQSLGGFNMAKDPRSASAHKPARRFVPAGSVYYFSHQNNAVLNPNLVQNAITHYGAEIGFGQIIIGRW